MNPYLLRSTLSAEAWSPWLFVSVLWIVQPYSETSTRCTLSHECLHRQNLASLYQF